MSALVAEFLSTLDETCEDFERRLSQQAEVLTEIDAFRAGDRLERDELHGRALR